MYIDLLHTHLQNDFHILVIKRRYSQSHYVNLSIVLAITITWCTATSLEKKSMMNVLQMSTYINAIKKFMLQI